MPKISQAASVLLLKPNMITSGAQAEVQAPPEEVAFFTVRTLARTIPPAVPGITFLLLLHPLT